MMCNFHLLLSCCSGVLVTVMVAGGVRAEPSAERGYRLLLEKAYVPPSFDEETFSQVWSSWPEPLRSQAEEATPRERRRMAFSRYGLTPRPGDDSGLPLQYVVDKQGNWAPNCFTCHGGQLLGRVLPGLPNTHYAMETLTEEIRLTKLQLQKPLSPIDYGSFLFRIPLGTTVGTTNAVIFGVALAASRDSDLNIQLNYSPPRLLHHDMDAPPWWNFKKRSRIYVDGFAAKSHRALMQFALDRQNGPEKFRRWEDDFRDIFAYLESLEPPKYPFGVDRHLASRGREVFEQVCAECHGTYGANSSYPQRIVPIDEVGTDRLRLDALTVEHRANYGRSWFAHADESGVIADPGGYLAPPLDGIWASAPYLHNGAVPTLWHLLHASERPVVWRRTGDNYDREKVGLEVETWERIPESATGAAERRTYFDTRRARRGKTAVGHLFPEKLREDEKRAVLEYLKTL